MHWLQSKKRCSMDFNIWFEGLYWILGSNINDSSKVEPPITDHLRILAYDYKVYNLFKIFHVCKHKVLVECKKSPIILFPLFK